MSKHHLWGTDGGLVGSVAVETSGGPELAVVQISMTVCGWKNFDFWWHDVYSRAREMMETVQAEEKAATPAGDPT